MNYQPKTIELHGDRRLIYRCRKAGLELYNPVGEWNGYGYTRLPLVCQINSLGEMRKFNKIKRELEANPVKKKVLTEEEIVTRWAKRLSKLTGISQDDAEDIAYSKLNYKEQQIEELEERGYSVRREKVINKLRRSNPLRRIQSEEHAWAIIGAHKRHTESNYEELLEEAHELEAWGEMPKGYAKDYALSRMQYYEANEESTDY